MVRRSGRSGVWFVRQGAPKIISGLAGAVFAWVPYGVKVSGKRFFSYINEFRSAGKTLIEIAIQEQRRKSK